MQHLVDRPVEKPDVVGDEQNGPAEPLELVHQPTLGRPVEVVGGLVEDHGVGTLEEDPHEVHPAALTTRQPVDVVEQELLAEAQSVGQPGHDRLGLVAAVLAELLLEVGEELDVLEARVLGHLRAGLAQCVIEHVEPPTRQDVGEPDRLEAQPAEHRDLGQGAVGAADRRPPRGPHVGPGLVDDDRDESGLAGAVATHEGHLLARADHEGGIAEQGSVTDLDGE